MSLWRGGYFFDGNFPMKFSLDFSWLKSKLESSLHDVELDPVGFRKFSGIDFSAIWMSEVFIIMVSIWSIEILSLVIESETKIMLRI